MAVGNGIISPPGMCKMFWQFRCCILPIELQAREWYREDLVGQAIADSGVRRDSLFLTSKLHPRDLAQASTPI
jgi:hypothetical protein